MQELIYWLLIGSNVAFAGLASLQHRRLRTARLQVQLAEARAEAQAALRRGERVLRLATG